MNFKLEILVLALSKCKTVTRILDIIGNCKYKVKFMSFELLQKNIREEMSSSDKKNAAQFVHLNTALNNLINKGITASEHITIALIDDLENTLSKYKNILKEEGKSDLKGPLTRVRRLREYYISICNLDDTGMTFSELLMSAVKRKYEEKLWTGPVTPGTQTKILSKYVTYRTVAKEIIISACKEDPDLWEKVDLKKPGTLGSASKIIRDYIVGESTPTERVSNARIHYIEKFLFLPKGSLLKKMKRKIDHQNRGKQDSEKTMSQVNKKKIIVKELSPDLQKVFDEYSAYKINKIQPEIINITDKQKESIYYEMNTVVTEISRRKQSWTVNAKGKCGSQSAFKSQLLDFQNHCLMKEQIPFGEIGTKHLTDPLLLHHMVEYYKSKKSGSTSIVRLLNWIKRSVQKQGYLSFCGDMGGKSVEEYEDALELISNKYNEWSSDLEQSIGQRGNTPSEKGKSNIRFLLKYDKKTIMAMVHDATKYLVSRAISFQQEAHYKIKILKSIKGAVAKEKTYKSAASYIRQSMNYIQAAVVQEVSFYNCPRALNWTMLKYYPNAKCQNNSFSSLTFLRQKNRFHLFIPLRGASIINVKENESRYLKNSDAKNTVNVDVELPEHLTPLIKKLIDIRADYIAMDLVRYGNANSENIELLLPWRSYRASQVTDPRKRKEKELFITDEAKFSENFSSMTYTAYLHTASDEKQHGINHHAMRHLAAETHLMDHPGDFIGAAGILNDDVEQIIKTYGDKDRGKAMRRVAQSSLEINYF